MKDLLGRHRRILVGAGLCAAAIASALVWNVFIRAPSWKVALSTPTGSPVPVSQLTRVSPDQYRQIISDVFGESIQLTGRFVEPGIRSEGLLAVGASEMTVTSAGLEAADSLASEVAEQVFAPEYRTVLMPCAPHSATAADDQCAAKFFEPVGRLLFRRTMTPDEVQVYILIANRATASSGDFFTGMKMSLQQMLISPDFLFRRIEAEPNSRHPGEFVVKGLSRASRLSFFLWNSAPDSRLLQAAEKGELDTPSGLAREVDRLMLSPRLGLGVRAFFVDLLGFDDFTILNKDTVLFPQFTTQVVSDAQEQTLKTIADLLLARDGDYRDLFTTRHTFLTPALGALYGVPVIELSQNGAPDRWHAYDFPEGDMHSGLLTQASFVALHSHPGRTSPTARGKALREHLLCQKVPPPPGDVDFSLVQDISNPKFKTARQRLGAHASQPACAGCHKITDPIGLALENFDAAGVLRTTERGAEIDASGELNGVRYDGPAALGRTLHDDPSVPACLVARMFEYGANREVQGADLPALRTLQSEFSKDGYRIRALMKAIATDDIFYRASKPKKQLDALPVFTAGQPEPVSVVPLSARQ